MVKVFINPFLTYHWFFPYFPNPCLHSTFLPYKHFKFFSSSFSAFYSFIILLMKVLRIELIHVLVCLLSGLVEG